MTYGIGILVTIITNNLGVTWVKSIEACVWGLGKGVGGGIHSSLRLGTTCMRDPTFNTSYTENRYDQKGDSTYEL